MIRRVLIFCMIVFVFTGCLTDEENTNPKYIEVIDSSREKELELKDEEIIKLQSEVNKLNDRIVELEAEMAENIDTIAIHRDRADTIEQWVETSVYFLGNKRYSRIEMPPQNEAINDESFMVFITEFKKAILERDAEYVIEHLDGSSLQPYMDSGPDFNLFIEEYGLVGDDLDNASFWEIMEEILDLGFEDISTDDSKAYYAPYFGEYRIIVESWDEFSESWGICTGENVNIRSKPSIEATIIDQVDYLVIEYSLEQDYDTNWTQVILPDGRVGYVHDDYIRSDFDYRCIFQYKDNKWLMTMLMAGC